MRLGGAGGERIFSSTWVIWPHNEAARAGCTSGIFLTVCTKKLDLCSVSVVLG